MSIKPIHEQSPFLPSRTTSRHRNGLVLVLVLTPVLLLISILGLVWITPLRLANRSTAWELRATYLYTPAISPPLSNPAPSNGFSMIRWCPHLFNMNLRLGPFLYAFTHTRGIPSDDFSMVSIASAQQTPRIEALVGQALNSAGIPSILSGSRGGFGIFVLNCDRKMAIDVLKNDASSNRYAIRFPK
jgi:hypothetical protein